MEIYPGTGVMVEKLAWAYATNANSSTTFVRHLLTAVFPVEILLVSNLRGGKRGRGHARLPLDKNKLDAIYSKFLAFYGMFSQLSTLLAFKDNKGPMKNKGHTYEEYLLNIYAYIIVDEERPPPNRGF